MYGLKTNLKISCSTNQGICILQANKNNQYIKHKLNPDDIYLLKLLNVYSPHEISREYSIESQRIHKFINFYNNLDILENLSEYKNIARDINSQNYQVIYKRFILVCSIILCLLIIIRIFL